MKDASCHGTDKVDVRIGEDADDGIALVVAGLRGDRQQPRSRLGSSAHLESAIFPMVGMALFGAATCRADEKM